MCDFQALLTSLVFLLSCRVWEGWGRSHASATFWLPGPRWWICGHQLWAPAPSPDMETQQVVTAERPQDGLQPRNKLRPPLSCFMSPLIICRLMDKQSPAASHVFLHTLLHPSSSVAPLKGPGHFDPFCWVMRHALSQALQTQAGRREDGSGWAAVEGQ